MSRPERSVSLNVCTVRLPRPVSLSGVRLAVKLTPHGPDHEVNVAATFTSQGPGGSFGAVGMTSASGCPDSMRDMSGSGPLGPIFNGVWQSLHPPTVTRYAPRAIFFLSAPFGDSARATP